MPNKGLWMNQSFFSKLESFSFLTIFGEKAKEFLQGQLTCDLAHLKLSEAIFGSYCDYKGRVLANFWLWQQDSERIHLLLPTTMREQLKKHLTKFALFSKVKIEENSTFKALFYCSNSPMSSEGFNGKIQENLVALAKIPVRLPNDYLLYLLVYEEVYDQSNLFSNSIKIFDETISNFLLVLSGICLIQPETAELFIPQMLGLDQLGAVSFRKGCYVGQEVIARTQHLGKLKRHLYRAKLVLSPSLKVGDNILNSDQEVVGKVAAYSHDLTESHVLGVIQDSVIGQPLLLACEPLKELSVVSFPEPI